MDVARMHGVVSKNVTGDEKCLKKDCFPVGRRTIDLLTVLQIWLVRRASLEILLFFEFDAQIIVAESRSEAVRTRLIRQKGTSLVSIVGSKIGRIHGRAQRVCGFEQNAELPLMSKTAVDEQFDRSRWKIFDR